MYNKKHVSLTKELMPESGKISGAFKYRLYPTKEQAEKLDSIFHGCRWIYNWANGLSNDHYEKHGKSLDSNHVSKRFTLLKKDPGYTWLKELPSQVCQQVLINYKRAWANAFREYKKTTLLNPPKYKSRFGAKMTARWPSQTCKLLPDGFVQVSKVGIVKYKSHRELPHDARVLSSTLSKDIDGRYFISMTFVREDTIHPHIKQYAETKTSIGIDLGITSLVESAQGDLHTVDAANLFSRIKQYEKVLENHQRKLALSERKHVKVTLENGKTVHRPSGQWVKRKRLVSRAFAKIRRMREDFLHKLTHHISVNFDIVVVEDLDIKAMLKSKFLARAIQRMGWGKLLTYLRYKIRRMGGHMLKVFRYFPSSKTCSDCGHVMSKGDMDLSVRMWECPSCNSWHDRDKNASTNIENIALTGIINKLETSPSMILFNAK